MSNPADFLPRRGRPGTTLIFEVVRELAPDEVLALSANDGELSRLAPPAIQKVTARHHRIAQFVAQGRKSSEIALIMGMTAQRVRDLRETDPSFRELVAAYQAGQAEVAQEAGARIRGTMEDGLEIVVNEIHDRVSDPERLAALPMGELREVGKFLADRTVAPPRQAAAPVAVPTQITFNIGGRGLQPKEPAPAPAPKMIDHEPEDV